MLTIYHNPRCRKSREALSLIEEAGVDFEIREYLKTPPSEQELTQVLQKLGISPVQLLRKGESIYKEQFKGKDFTDEQWIAIMVANPKLIERPIVIKGQQAVIGRPTEQVKTLLS